MKKLFCFIGFLTICCHALFSEELALDFSGDVRTKWKCTNQKESNDHNFILESNVNCNYFEDNTWMEAKAKISLSSVTSEPFEPSICLERTYIGFALSDLVYLELGRNNLDNLFDSKVQYKSHFNGAHLSFQQNMGKMGAVLIHGGPYIEDCSQNKFAAVGEIAVKNLFETNLDVTYGLTYHTYDLISQATFKFPFRIGSDMGMKVTPYVAMLRNHDFHENGMYFGALFGEVKKAKDFSVDINIQNVSCVPVHDFAGVGKGIYTKMIYAFTDKFHAQVKASLAQAHHNVFEGSLIYNW